jgi:hypothetical protein
MLVNTAVPPTATFKSQPTNTLARHEQPAATQAMTPKRAMESSMIGAFLAMVIGLATRNAPMAICAAVLETLLLGSQLLGKQQG